MFNKKKNDDFDMDVPEFDDAPSQENMNKASDSPKFPSFDQEFGTIKQEIGKPTQNSKPMGQKPMQVHEDVPMEHTDLPHAGNKPIFVKVENYKEAIESINNIKDLIREADSLLDEVHKIRSEEDRELEKWHRDLDKVKDKLLEVDKNLFES